MTSSAQYRIELVSAESESGESAMVRGSTSFAGKVRRQKYYRPRQRIPDSCRSWKRLGVATCIFFVSLVFLWMFVLSMMTAELFKRTLDLQRMTKRISAQTELLPEEMQTYQSMSKYMQKNQTQLNSQLTAVSRKITNVSSQLSKVEKATHNIEEKFRSFPDLINVPSQVVTLSSSVAGLGSEVEDMKTSLSRFRDEEDGHHQSLVSLKSNIQTLTNDIVTLNQTFSALNDAPAPAMNPVVSVNYSSINENVIGAIEPKISELNESLSRRIRYTLEDQEKDHKMLIDLQESLVNVTSQIMSLSQNTDESRANFNNLVLKILEVREQLRAMTTQKVSSEIMTTSATTIDRLDMTTSAPSGISLFNGTNLLSHKSGLTLKFDTTSGSSVGAPASASSPEENMGPTTKQ